MLVKRRPVCKQRRLSRTVEITPRLFAQCSRRPQQHDAGTLELVNLLSNNTWQLTTNRDTDSLQWWFGENRANWKRVASMEPNGDVQFNYKLHITGNAFWFLQSPAAVVWQNAAAAAWPCRVADPFGGCRGGRSGAARSGRETPAAGRGNTAANYPAALTVAPAGWSRSLTCRRAGRSEANLQAHQAARQSTALRGDVLSGMPP